MKSTFLRMLFLSVASAAFLRAMCGIQGIAPARLTMHRSNDPGDESFIAIWGLSPCGGGLVIDAGTTSNDGVGSRGVTRLWQARSENDFCVCELPQPNISEAEPLLALRELFPNGEWADAEAGYGHWASGWSGCGCVPADGSVPNMIGDGVGMPYYVGPSEPSPDCKSSARVEAVEFSRAAHVVLVGYGLKAWTPPVGIGGSDVFWPSGIPEEPRLMLVGGPAAVAAFDRSASEGVLAALSEGNGSSNLWANSDAAWYLSWSVWDGFSADWNQSGSRCLSAFRRVCGLPLCPAGRASISSLVTTIAASENGERFEIAADDGTLHLCYRNSLEELCRLKQSPDGAWRVLASNYAERIAQENGRAASGSRKNRLDSTESDRFLTWIQVSMPPEVTRTAFLGPETCAHPPEEHPDGGTDEFASWKLDAIDAVLRKLGFVPRAEQAEIFSFSLGGACR